MSLKNMTLLNAATIAASGGTAINLADDGVTVQNGVHLIVTEDTDFQTRRQVTVKNRPPTLDAKTSEYGKDKKSISFAQPVILTSGKVVFNTIRLEREIHPSTSAADAAILNGIGAQLLTDADTVNFWTTGSLS